MRLPMAAFAFFLVHSLAIGLPYAQTPPIIDQDIDVTAGDDASGRPQNETTIAIHPSDPNIIVAGAQDLRLVSEGGHRWHGYYRSTDGGSTWSVSLVPGFPGDNSPEGSSSALHDFGFTGDPVLAFDGQGNVYYSGVALSFTRHGDVLRNRGFVAKYVNDGADFAFVTLTPGADKPWIAVDTSGGSHDGTVYLVYLGNYRGQSVPQCVRSTDGGVTFSKPVVVGDGFPAGVVVDTMGRVYAASFPGDGTILVSRSDDGGVTFLPPVTAASGLTQHLTGSLPGNNFRANTVPQIAADNAGVYIVTDDFANGFTDGDILLIRSNDGGVTWAAPVRVNDVTTNQQFFPSVAVAGGTLHVIWYDSRLGQLPSGEITALDVFYAYSTDGGASFSNSVRVTSTSFDPNLVLQGDLFSPDLPFIGDYIQVAAALTTAHVLWTDNRNACSNIDPVFGCTDQDVFTAKITYGQ